MKKMRIVTYKMLKKLARVVNTEVKIQDDNVDLKQK